MWKLVLLVCLFVHCGLSVRTKSSLKRITCKWEKTNTPEALFPNSVVWDKARHSAYYVTVYTDSQQPCIFRYDAKKNYTYSAYVKGPSDLGTPGCIIPVKGGNKFVVTFNKTVCIVSWDGYKKSAKFVKDLFDMRDEIGPEERIFIGHRDPTGRALYVGKNNNALCNAEPNATVILKQRGFPPEKYFGFYEDLIAPLGYGFANGCVYILGSCKLKIWAFPDPNSKYKDQCGKERVVIDFTKYGKSLDNFALNGLEADKDGILYSCNYYDGCIYAIDPIACEFRKVYQLPVKGAITSLSFGEDNEKGGQNLYVTVSNLFLNITTVEVIGEQHPGCAMFKIKMKKKGFTFKRLCL